MAVLFMCQIIWHTYLPTYLYSTRARARARARALEYGTLFSQPNNACQEMHVKIVVGENKTTHYEENARVPTQAMDPVNRPITP